MKTLLISLFFAGILSAQYAPVPATQYPTLEVILNAKPAITKAAGVPASNCTVALDLYLNISNGDLYVCYPVNVWLKITGAGGAGTWGTIGGTLANQADLVAALLAKVGTADSRLTDARTPLVHAPSHATGGSDPVTVTAAQVGLGNANNTSDANKPISTAETAALGTKADKTTANTYTAGAKQGFQSSASTAGMNFGGVAADPSGLAEGDTWYRTDLKVMRQYRNGAAVTVPAFDPAGNLVVGATVLRGGGVSLPGTCAIGDQYFLTTGTTGNYQCTATNTWTLPGGGSMTYPAAPGVTIAGSGAWGTSVLLPADGTKYLNGAGAFTVPAGGAAPTIFTALHTGFTTYSNPESSITGTVSYTDYSSQAAPVYRGPIGGIATVTEPASMTRAMVSITSAFQAAAGAPAISALQVSIGTAANSTAYMNPVQVGYSLSLVAPLTTCTGGQPTFVVSSPVSPVIQSMNTLVTSGVVQAAYNGTFTGIWTTSTTFVTSSPAVTCVAYTITSGGMAGIQGLIAGNFAALPQGIGGTNTVYLYLTVTNSNPANFSGNLLAGGVKVMLEGVQVQ